MIDLPDWAAILLVGLGLAGALWAVEEKHKE